MNTLWNYARDFYSSKDEKYHGLINQGSTCYLNSVLQVLFMTKDFRAAVQRHSDEHQDTECIDRQLSGLFADLKTDTAHTVAITNKLGIDRVNVQRDASEYFEKILAQTSPGASQIFRGLLAHNTRCHGCNGETSADGQFWNLPLALVDSSSENYSVVDLIENFFRDSDFSGENQIYCKRCDAKHDATVECVIKRHPDVLMLLLKRFEFSYRCMSYVKNNRAVDVPSTVQIPQDQTYELYAFVEHFGGLKSGHYTATIKCRDEHEDRWYNFNDSTVTPLNCNLFQVDNIESFPTRSQSAYLLFYRKKTYTGTQNIWAMSTSGGSPPAISVNNDQHPDAERRDGSEDAVEVGNTAAAVPINRNDETGFQDRGRGAGLPPDHWRPVKPHHSGVYATSPDVHVGKQGRDEWEKMRDDEEDRRGAEDTGIKDRAGATSNRAGLPPDRLHSVEVWDSGVYAKQSELYSHQDYEGRMCDKIPAGRVGKQGRDEWKKVRDDEEDRRRPAELLSKDTRFKESIRDRENARLGEVTESRSVHLQIQDGVRDAQRRVMVGKTGGDEERMEEMKEKAAADKWASRSDAEQRKHDSYKYRQDITAGSHSKQNMLKNDQGAKEGISNTRYDQQGERKRDVQGDHERKRGEDEHAPWRETSMPKHYFHEGAEDEDKRRFVDVRQNRAEQQNKGKSEQVQNRETGSEGQGRRTEKHGAGSEEKTGAGHSKAKAGVETDAQDTVSEDVCNLKTSKTNQECAKRNGSRQEGDETSVTPDSNAKKVRKDDAAKHESKKKGVNETTKKSKLGFKNKTTKCSPCSIM